MRIAFYAPMKPPTSDVPSGDRRMARLLMQALAASGHDVNLASDFQSREPAGDPVRQQEIMAEGQRIAEDLVSAYEREEAAGPDLWFTYHLYYKAPDWIGPAVADRLGIPYVVAEASHAPKRAGGQWDLHHRQTEVAIRRADRVFGLNTLDAGCVTPLLSSPEKLVQIKPFLDLDEMPPVPDRRANREKPARLVTAGMMRSGDKLESYKVLAAALKALPEDAWSLDVAGDGPERAAVEALFAGLPVSFLGELPPNELSAAFDRADLFVWPAVNEAYGMALLEAQSRGLPVVAGRTHGVPDIVRDGVTGRLAAVGQADAFAEAVRGLIDNPKVLSKMSQAAREIVAAEHGLESAAAIIDQEIRAVAA